MKSFAPALGLMFLTACATGAPAMTSGPVPVTPGDAASFAPLVPSTSEGARCIEPSGAQLDPGTRAVAMRYSGPPQRQVTVTLDAEGTPTRYVDVRGDFDAGGDDLEDRTTIGLYLEQGYAVLSNRSGNESPTMLEVPVDDVLTSPRLGDPTSVIEEVLESCATGA